MRCADLHTDRGKQAMGQVRESGKVGAVPSTQGEADRPT
jgi:hypothetical protein